MAISIDDAFAVIFLQRTTFLWLVFISRKCQILMDMIFVMIKETFICLSHFLFIENSVIFYITELGYAFMFDWIKINDALLRILMIDIFKTSLLFVMISHFLMTELYFYALMKLRFLNFFTFKNLNEDCFETSQID